MTADQDSLWEQFDALQSRWRLLSKDHEHHYLEYLAPCASVDFVLVAKMPSISEKEAAETPPGEFPEIGPPSWTSTRCLTFGELPEL